MLNAKSFLSLDFGAGSLKLAEFDVTEAGTLRLRRYGIRALGLAGSQDTARENAIKKALQELAAERPFQAKVAGVCAPGTHVFSKFVKLPPVDSSKVTQIIQYEAQQNVPFPLDEVVWDYQILGAMPSGELEVLLVAIKTDVVEGLFRLAEASNLRLNLVDASPAALCNAFRYNYGDPEGCTMLLDIGAKTSNLLFFEKGKVYSRGINIGANAITQEFAAEAKMRFDDAEKFKIAEGFVSLGGAYEEPENPRQAQVSKIARQVMTRLHIQVNQTIQFYRGQQGGSAPTRLFLAGGASLMPYTAQFFAEKLNVDVEYFNPFRNIQIDPSVNLEELAKVAHSFGEVVGVGLRAAAQCPIELNLVPKSIRQRQQFDQKKPYFIATVFSLVLVIFAYGWFYDKVAALKRETYEELSQNVEPVRRRAQSLDAVMREIDGTQKQLNQLTAWLQERFYWADLLSELRRVCLAAEARKRRPGVEPGLWIERFSTVAPELQFSQEEEEGPRPMMMDPRFLMRYFPQFFRQMQQMRGGEGGEGGAPMMPGFPGMPGQSSQPSTTNQIEVINLTCRGVKISETENIELAAAFLAELRASPMVDTNGTEFAGQMESMEDTFSFGVKLKLKTPVKL
jgi:type IV pilus assembly protein PilM